MSHRVMQMSDAVGVARLWQAAGGQSEVELGALEPLLWRDGTRAAPDLVSSLTRAGFRVTMTTNASRLASMAIPLRAAGLSLLRISWHTTDPARYREISGQGDYAEFSAGINAAVAAELPISFNRVLLRGHVGDLPQQLDFVQRHDCRLKLYDLLWTPEIAAVYGNVYEHWREVVREHVLPRSVRIERVGRAVGRRRIRFHLRHAGRVEVKIGDRLIRPAEVCGSCAHRGVCKEEFGDYLRVEPDLHARFCYLRRDIAIDLRPMVDSANGPALLRAALREIAGDLTDALLANSSLRYIAVPYCNFNCRIPGTTISWCHKTSGPYSFPGRPRIEPLRLVG